MDMICVRTNMILLKKRDVAYSGYVLWLNAEVKKETTNTGEAKWSAWGPAFDVEAWVDGVPQHLEDAGEALRQVHALEHWPAQVKNSDLIWWL